MPRDGSGNYTLVPGNPVVPGTTIASDWANSTMDDIGNALTNSLSRNGNGGMLARLLHIDGAVGVPSISFTNDTLSGFYLAAAGDMRVASGTVDVMRWQPTGAQVWDQVDLVWRDILTSGSTSADNISLDDTSLPFTAANVQEGFDNGYTYQLNATVESTTYQNPSTPANEGIIRALSTVGEHRIEIWGGEPDMDGGLIWVTGPNGGSPNSVLIGANNTPVLIAEDDQVIIPDRLFTPGVFENYGQTITNPAAGSQSYIGPLLAPSRNVLVLNARAPNPEDAYIDMYGSGDSVLQDTIILGTGGVNRITIDNSGVTIAGLIVPSFNAVNSIQFSNPNTPGNLSSIEAIDGVGDEGIALYGQDAGGPGGYVEVYGSNSATTPNTVFIGTSGGPEITVENGLVTIPNLAGGGGGLVNIAEITFQNPNELANISLIRANPIPGGDGIELWGDDSFAGCGYVKVNGALDLADPSAVVIGTASTDLLKVTTSGVRAEQLSTPQVDDIWRVNFENGSNPTRESQIFATQGNTHSLQIYGTLSSPTDSYVHVFGDEDPNTPNTIVLGTDGVDRITVDSTGVQIPSFSGVQSLTFENGSGPEVSTIQANQGVGRRRLELYGNTDETNGAFITIAGDDDDVPYIIRMGSDGPGGSRLVVNTVGVDIPTVIGVEDIQFVNAATPANINSISAIDAANREGLQLAGGTEGTPNGRVLVYGAADSTYPDHIRICSDTTEANAQFYVDNTASYVKDLGGAESRTGWQPRHINFASTRNVVLSDFNNHLFVTGTRTYTLNTAGPDDGVVITMITDTGATLTLQTASGVVITWQQGGSSLTGVRTVAQNSIIRLYKVGDQDYRLEGNGIS